MIKKHTNFIGKTQLQVIESLGHSTYKVSEDIWVYVVKKTLFGRKTVIIIVFENQLCDIILVKMIFGKIQLKTIQKFFHKNE